MRMKLLNAYEELTYDRLRAVCEPCGAHVFPKVRVADVFQIRGSGLNDRQYSFSLRSHFDFIVTDSGYNPLFSVEYDGPVHKISPTQVERDTIKQDICRHFHQPLLRVNSRYLTRQFRGLDLLTYFVDGWFLEEAFDDAQKKGLVPYDEPFDPTFIYSSGGVEGTKWPYWLSLDIQMAIKKLHERGRVAQMAPFHFVGLDEQENYRCISWLRISKKRFVRVSTGMRAQDFPAVSKAELISMLAMFDLFEHVKKALSGNYRITVEAKKFQNELDTFRSR